jgi:aspartate/methionine/tyrosine aminotransferase
VATTAMTHKRLVSQRSSQVSASVFDDISRMILDHGAADIALGAPDFPAPASVKEAAVAAIRADANQYTDSRGSRSLREAIAAKTFRCLGIETDPGTEITVTCGATEAMAMVLMATVDPGDEVIVFEPFLSDYVTAVRLNGGVLRSVRLQPPEWLFCERELAEAFTARTKAVILNTPSNPSGKVFSHDELRLTADLCHRWNALCIMDEVYEHLVFDGRQHCSVMQFEDARERTVLVNTFSKTYRLTGWRLGFVIAPAEITAAIQKIHECVTVCAPAPLQEAGVVALQLPSAYYQELRGTLQERRDRLARILEGCGFRCYKPQGACYLMADIGRFGFADDLEFARFLIRDLGVGAIPGSTFYSQPADGARMLRFCFAKTEETLCAAEQRLARLGPASSLGPREAVRSGSVGR